MAKGRNVMMAGLAGLALGVYLGNSMKKGYVTKRLRSTGHTIMKKARGTVEEQLNNWMD